MIAPVAHLLGNGPSRSTFIEKPEGDVYTINQIIKGVRSRAVFCADALPAIKLKTAVIIPVRLERWARREGYKVLSTIAQPTNGISTGHVAYDWLCEQGYREIHLWGFDSIWRETVESDTIGAKCATNWVRWRVEWEKRLTQSSPTTFIHTTSSE